MLNPISRNASCFVFLSLVLTLAASAALAQVQPDSIVEQAADRSGPTVTAAVTADRVRFTSPNTVVQLRLEVYDEAGQKLLDTEQRGGNVLDWHLQGSAGERVADGVYVCVLTSKNLSGRLSQKLGMITVSGPSTTLRSAAVAELNLRQAQTVGPVEIGQTGLTVMGAEEAPPATVLANNGNEAQLARTRGPLTFRVGDFFSGIDTEQMRLTEAGNLGIGTSEPKATLDVAGTVRAQRFLIAKATPAGAGKSATDAAEFQPLIAGTGSTDRIAKWTDDSGTLGNSAITETGGLVGIGTTTPTQALEVANGRIVATGSQTLAAPAGIIEIGTTITNNTNQASGIRMRNLFNGNAINQVALDVGPTFAPSASISLARGFISGAFFAPQSGVTITDAYGGNAVNVYGNTGGAVTNGTAFALSSPIAFGSLKPTTQFGLHINNQGIAGTANSYGLFVDAQSGSANNYSAVFAGGNVGIGTIAPAYKLHVVGQDVRVEGNAPGIFPRFSFNFIGGSTDEKRWQNYASPKALNFTSLNDAETAETFWLQVNRGTGTAISSVVLPNGNVGLGAFGPSAKLSVVAPGSTEIAGAAMSSTLRTTAGTLGTTAGDELSLASIGFLAGSGNNSSLGIRGRRIIDGTSWTTTAIGLGMDVDNTVRAGDATLWLHANGNVGIGQSNPTAKLTVEGTVQSNSGGFKFPDGSVQTTAAANATYTNIHNIFTYGSVFVPNDQSYISILHLDLPTATYQVTVTFEVANTNSDAREVQCRFTGDNGVDYRFDIFGPSQQLITMHTIESISSGGVDAQCHVLFTNNGTNSNIYVNNTRLTAVKIAGSVNVQ